MKLSGGKLVCILCLCIILAMIYGISTTKSTEVSKPVKRSMNKTMNIELKEQFNQVVSSEVVESTEIEVKELNGFVYPKELLQDPIIIFIPNDDVLRTFPKKVVYGVYCALTEGLGTDASDFFVSSWDKDEDGLYSISIGFNSGISVDLQVDSSSGAYKCNKSMNEAVEDAAHKQARGEDIFKFPQETVGKCIEWVTKYTDISNPELTTLNERNCCWVVWYNDVGVDRFIKIDKTTEEMNQRGHYDDLKQEYVVDWEEDT